MSTQFAQFIAHEKLSATADIMGIDSENESDDEVKVGERVSIDKCIQLTTELIEALEQRDTFTEQQVMTLYLMKESLIKEKPKVMKQTTVDNWLKRATSASKRCTVEHPSSTSTADASPDTPRAEIPDDPPAISM